MGNGWTNYSDFNSNNKPGLGNQNGNANSVWNTMPLRQQNTWQQNSMKQSNYNSFAGVPNPSMIRPPNFTQPNRYQNPQNQHPAPSWAQVSMGNSNWTQN